MAIAAGQIPVSCAHSARIFDVLSSVFGFQMEITLTSVPNP